MQAESQIKTNARWQSCTAVQLGVFVLPSDDKILYLLVAADPAELTFYLVESLDHVL